MNFREVSDRQEKRIEKQFKGYGAKKTKNSGGNMFIKGDVLTDEIHFEGKTKAKLSESISLKREWVEKGRQEAIARRKRYFVLVFDFGDDKDFYAINGDDFEYFYDSAKKLEKIKSEMLNNSLDCSIMDSTDIKKLREIIKGE